METKILIVEDDKNMGFLLKENLKLAKYIPELITDGNKAVKAFQSDEFSLCILDIMLPGNDGLSIAKDIKSISPKTPVIFLTAKSMDEDKIAGFKAGCDDYITKPFNIEELLLRIQVVLRRKTDSDIEVIQSDFTFGSFILKMSERKLYFENEITGLSAKEADLIKILVENKNKVVTRNQILMGVWGADNFYVSKSLDVYLTKIRKIFKKDDQIELLNIHGLGYKLTTLDS